MTTWNVKGVAFCDEARELLPNSQVYLNVTLFLSLS